MSNLNSPQPLRSVVINGSPSTVTAIPGTFHEIDAAGGAVTVILPTSNGGDQVLIKKIDTTGNVVTISGVIGGNQSLLPLRVQDQGVTFLSDQAGGWLVINAALSLASVDGRYSQSGTLPAALAANGVAGHYDATRSVYNLTPANTRNLRAGLARARAGTGSVRIGFVGDSTTAGYGALAATQSVPVLIRNALANLGYPTQGTGPVVANPGANGNAFTDSRWAFTGTWSAVTGSTDFTAQTNTNGATATFTSDLPGTTLEFCTFNNTGAYSYQIDGGATVPITPTGAATLNRVVITGLANTTHTLKFTATSTTTTYISWCDVRGTNGVSIANFGTDQSQTVHWTDTFFIQSGAQMVNWAPQVTFIDLGINDLVNSVTLANYTANMQTLITRYLALGDVILLTPNPTQNENHLAFNTALYGLAGTNNVPLIDLYDRLGSWAGMNALGMTSDSLHPNATGYAEKAAGIMSALVLPTATLDSRFAAAIPPGTLAVRPPAVAGNTGAIYTATDQAGGTPFQSTGSAWVQVGSGVTQPGGYQLAHAEITSNPGMTVTPANTPAAISGLSVTFTLTTATICRIKVSGVGLNGAATAAILRIKVWDGAVGTGTKLMEVPIQTNSINILPSFQFEVWPTLASGTHTLNCSFETDTNNTPAGFILAGGTTPFALDVAKA